ncbi:hypothetical protein [Aminobacter sp. MSH1]|uniref:hypothetical protein n=1 Tax=Aminobacter sp. MSH1 TaxID=374606 RepID=UPI001FDF7461|nr:hypothetical protein [Aminobacter sp. MSH1]
MDAVEEHGDDEEHPKQRLDILAERFIGPLREILAGGVDPIQEFADKVVHRPALFSALVRQLLDRRDRRRSVRVQCARRTTWISSVCVAGEIGRPLAWRGLLARRPATC